MTESSDTTTRTRTVSIAASPFVTVSTILALADELRAKQMPLRERVECRHAEDTRHLVGFLVRTSESWPTGQEPAS